MAPTRKRKPDWNEEESSERDYSINEEGYLADVHLGELQKMRADGSRSLVKKQRENNNRLLETRGKVPLQRFREVMQARKKVFRDPKFDSARDSFDDDRFRKDYHLLFDVELPSERKKLEAMVNKCKNLNRLKELQEHIDWIDNQLEWASSMNAQGELLGESKKKEREDTKHEKHPSKNKKSEIHNWKLEKNDEEIQEDELERYLADIPLGELQKMRADGSQSFFKMQRLHEARKSKRENKNRPMEMSSKIPVKRFREVIQAPKMVCRDPRFDPACGSFDADRFRKNYSFLFDVELPSERKKLQAMVKKCKDSNRRKELQENIDLIDKQLEWAQSKNGKGETLGEHKKKTGASKKEEHLFNNNKSESGNRKLEKYNEVKNKELKPSRTKNLEADILAEHKKTEREAIKLGKRPFYLKRSEIRKRVLMQKYEELKASGKLEAFMAKRRKKNAAKDARFMPYCRTASSSADYE